MADVSFYDELLAEAGGDTARLALRQVRAVRRICVQHGGLILSAARDVRFRLKHHDIPKRFWKLLWAIVRRECRIIQAEKTADTLLLDERTVQVDMRRHQLPRRRYKPLHTVSSLDKLTMAYVECALWSSTVSIEGHEHDGDPMDKHYSIYNIHPESLDRMAAQCAKFQRDNEQWITEEHRITVSEFTADEMAGHDFWLTRCGHGAGFWDGDWSKEAGAAMTEYSERAGVRDLHVGDDGFVHECQG